MAQQGVTISFYLTDRTCKKLEAICLKRGENKSRVISELIDHAHLDLRKEHEEIDTDNHRY